ncbi:MAG TPA: LPP20 family lipoprotein [Melioribacteraceae bacterium]|nr:LPP20 family lipoprotein [Melioribacteraceae bacterium]
MKKFFCNCLILFIFFGLSVKAQNLPAWISNPNAMYPDISYLAAVGEGDNRKAAENNALSNLALIFKSDIKVDNTQIDKYNELFGDKEGFQHESNVTKKVNVTGGQTLYNVKFGETFTNNLGRVFIIAYIERLETAEIYNDKINSNTEKIKFFVSLASSTNDILTTYAALSASSFFALDNEMLKSQLKIINPHFSEFSDTDYDYNDINKKSIDAAKKISFNVNIENDNDQKVSTFVKELFNSKGFVINSNPIINVTGNISYEKLDLQRKEKFVSWTLFLNLINSSNETILTTSFKGREGSVSYDAALSRCINEIGKKVKYDFNKKIIDFFDGLVKK